jgi:hypothetical protein
LVFAVSAGCKNTNSKSTLEFQVTTRLENDIMTLFIIPRDANGKLLDLDGTLSVKFWDKTDSNPPATGDLVGQWDNIKLKSAGFQDGRGTKVSLEPNGAFTGKSGSQAYIELALSAGGKSYSAEGIVILGDLPACCGQS